MPNIFNSIGVGEAIDPAARAVDAWKRISDKPSSITTKRVGEPQTVRIELDNYGTESSGDNAAGRSSIRKGIIFGVRDHPTVDDTDIQRDDRFALDGIQYKVIDIVLTLGEIQASFEAMT